MRGEHWKLIDKKNSAGTSVLDLRDVINEGADIIQRLEEEIERLHSETKKAIRDMQRKNDQHNQFISELTHDLLEEGRRAQAWVEEAKMAQKAVGVYGKHLPDCMSQSIPRGRIRCDCGFEDAQR